MNLIYLCDSNILIGTFLFVFFIYFNKLLPKNQHMVMTLSTCTLLTIGLLFVETITAYLIDFAVITTLIDKFILHLLIFLQLACKTYLPIIWTLFIYTYKKRQKKLYKKNILLMCLLGHIFAALLLTTNLTGWIFTIGTVEDVLVEGPLYKLPSYIALIYSSSCIIYLIADKKSLSVLESRFLGSACLIQLIGSIIEIVYTQSFLLSSVTGVSILLTYILLQDYIADYDLKTSALNRVRFEAILDSKEKNEKNDFSIIYLLVENTAQNIIEEVGENKNDLIADFGKILTTLLGKDDILSYYGENKYVLFFNTSNTEYIFDKLNILNNNVLKYNNVATQANLKYYYSIVKYDKTFSKVTDILKKAYIDVINIRKEKKQKEEKHELNISNNN